MEKLQLIVMIIAMIFTLVLFFILIVEMRTKEVKRFNVYSGTITGIIAILSWIYLILLV